MRITVGQLRRIIKETIEEETLREADDEKSSGSKSETPKEGKHHFNPLGMITIKNMHLSNKKQKNIEIIVASIKKVATDVDPKEGFEVEWDSTEEAIVGKGRRKVRNAVVQHLRRTSSNEEKGWGKFSIQNKSFNEEDDGEPDPAGGFSISGVASEEIAQKLIDYARKHIPDIEWKTFDGKPWSEKEKKISGTGPKSARDEFVYWVKEDTKGGLDGTFKTANWSNKDLRKGPVGQLTSSDPIPGEIKISGLSTAGYANKVIEYLRSQVPGVTWVPDEVEHDPFKKSYTISGKGSKKARDELKKAVEESNIKYARISDQDDPEEIRMRDENGNMVTHTVRRDMPKPNTTPPGSDPDASKQGRLIINKIQDPRNVSAIKSWAELFFPSLKWSTQGSTLNWSMSAEGPKWQRENYADWLRNHFPMANPYADKNFVLRNEDFEDTPRHVAAEPRGPTDGRIRVTIPNAQPLKANDLRHDNPKIRWEGYDWRDGYVSGEGSRAARQQVVQYAKENNLKIVYNEDY
jgi:hypothetical protein